jgi:hypothetical protein
MADAPEWQTAYQAAVLEVDNSKLSEKANKAKAEPAKIKIPAPSRTSTIKKTKKAQSIWKRPISELWRRQGI